MAGNDHLYRILSYLYPIRLLRAVGEFGDELEIRLENGRKVINSANANYSYGSLHRLWRTILKNTHISENMDVLVLGGGAGSIRDILHEEMKCNVRLTLVEHDGVILELAKEHFGVTSSDKVNIIHGSAFDFIEGSTDHFELVLIDLFQDRNVPEELGKEYIWRQLLDRTSTGGMIILNSMIYDDTSQRNVDRIRSAITSLDVEVTRKQVGEWNHVFIITTC